MNLRPGRRVAVAVAVSACLLTLGVGSALAVFPDSGVTTYTGCLTSGGNVNYIKAGDSPSQPCATQKQEVKLSGGDITRVAVTGALTGGGDNGAVTVGLDSTKTVPSSCSSGQVPKWNGSAWTCGADNDTTYSAGTGLSLSNANVFSVQSDAFTKKDQSCSSGFVTGTDSGGTFTCGTPASLPVYRQHVISGSEESVGDGGREWKTVATLSLPAGNFAITAALSANNNDYDVQTFECKVEGSGVSATSGDWSYNNVLASSGTDEVAHTDGFTLAGLVQLGSAGTLDISCNGYKLGMGGVLSALAVQ